MSKSPASRHKARFIAVVGPSGAGKDSVMRGLCALRAEAVLARRVITRPPDPESEDFDSVSEAEFAERAARGAFALHWTAHGLSYGIPNSVHDALERGHDVLANLSRSTLAEAAQVFGNVVVLHITAPTKVLLHRVLQRGREAEDAVQQRLSRQAPKIPEGLPVIEIDNSHALEDSISAAVAALYPDRG
ncbi:phosphonate metabolism protein/1,5-bisphosphokinase (PRPP-forming) PhnN [Gymnodinialimonas sp.]